MSEHDDQRHDDLLTDPERAMATARPDRRAARPDLAASPTPEHPGAVAGADRRDLAAAEMGGRPTGATAPGGAPASTGVPGNGTPGTAPDAGGGWSELMGDTMDLTTRWSAIQAGFVDEPRRAVEEARDLVGEVVHRLTSSFERESERLESRWSSGGEVDTEDLRMVLRHYRTFFQTLLQPHA